MGVTIAAAAEALNRYQTRYSNQVTQSYRLGLQHESMLANRGAKDAYTSIVAAQTDLLQPYQPGWTPKGDTTLSEVTTKLQPIKVDITIDQGDLEQHFHSWMVNWIQLGKSMLEWSFPRFLMETIWMPKIMEEIEINSYQGVYVAPTPGTAGTSISSVDGLGTVLAAAIIAGDVTPIAIGAKATIDNELQRVETFLDALPDAVKDKPGIIRTSPQNAMDYGRKHRELYGTGTGNGSNNTELRVDFSNKKVVGVPAMVGQDTYIYEPDNMKNSIVVTEIGGPSLPVIRFQEDKRVLCGLAEFKRGYGVEHYENVFISD